MSAYSCAVMFAYSVAVSVVVRAFDWSHVLSRFVMLLDYILLYFNLLYCFVCFVILFARGYFVINDTGIFSRCLPGLLWGGDSNFESTPLCYLQVSPPFQPCFHYNHRPARHQAPVPLPLRFPSACSWCCKLCISYSRTQLQLSFDWPRVLASFVMLLECSLCLYLPGCVWFVGRGRTGTHTAPPQARVNTHVSMFVVFLRFVSHCFFWVELIYCFWVLRYVVVRLCVATVLTAFRREGPLRPVSILVELVHPYVWPCGDWASDFVHDLKCVLRNCLLSLRCGETVAARFRFGGVVDVVSTCWIGTPPTTFEWPLVPLVHVSMAPSLPLVIIWIVLWYVSVLCALRCCLPCVSPWIL